jgi:hypothetical protein
VRSHIIESTRAPPTHQPPTAEVGLKADGWNAAPEFRKIAGISAGGERFVARSGQHRGLLCAGALEILKRFLQHQRRLGTNRVAAFRAIDRDQCGSVGVVLDLDLLHGYSLSTIRTADGARPLAAGPKAAMLPSGMRDLIHV